MDNTTNAQQVMGPGVPRVKVSTFNGQQNFANWQNQLSKSYISTQMDSMNPKCLQNFEELLASIKSLEERIAKISIKKHPSEEDKKEQQDLTMSLALKKTQLIGCQKEDLTFLALMQSSLAGIAGLIAFPPTDTFKLKEVPTLPGAIAYDLLQREYTAPKVHVFDRFGDKELLKQHFANTNLASPQIEVVLNGKVVEFASKHILEAIVVNDLYLEMLCEFLHHLPQEHLYETLHIKFRLLVSKLENQSTGGKGIFLEAIKEAQEVFKINKDIQKEGAALKTTMVARSKNYPKHVRPDAAAVEALSMKNQQQLLKPKNFCLNFNSPDGCNPRDPLKPCRHLHEKAPKEILDKIRATLQKKKATASLASANAALASIATAKKETISSSSNIKSSDFYCSLSSSNPTLLANEAYLDTGASHTMSPTENMFTDLTMSRVAIHCANDNVIHSTKVGIFHLNTVLEDGTQITLQIQNALFVPKLSATLISDRSLIQLGYSILIGKDKQLLQNGSMQIELERHPSGIIYFRQQPVYAHQATPMGDHSLLREVKPDNIVVNDVQQANIIEIKDSVKSVLKTKPGLPKIHVKKMSLADLQFKHEAFAHINIDATIAILRAEGYSISTAQRKAFFCSHCAQSKAKALPAHSDGAKSLRPTEASDNKTNIVSTIHTDVAGPIKPISPANEQYVISFREDTTNLMWTATFKSMDQVPMVMAKYLRDMSNSILSVPITPNCTVLLSDSAAVYLTPKMKQMLADHGIITAASVPYHPKSNSVSERGWQTLFGLARAMLSGAMHRSTLVTNDLWPQAIQHATLIINLTTLSHESNGKSAFEMITKTSPTKILQKLLPFGCSVFVKIESHHSKLESNGFHGLVVGYDLTSQGHMVHNTSTGKIIITVNIHADLSSFYKIADDMSPNVFDSSIEDIQAPQLENVVQPMMLENQHDVEKSPDKLDDSDIFRTPPDSPSGLAFLTATPKSLEQALHGPDRDKWMISLQKEMQAMKDNLVFEEAKDTGQPRMRSFFLLRVKPDDDASSGEMFKTRLVAGGNTQQPHRDYDPNRISSSVLKSSSMKMMMGFALENNLMLYHLDVRTAFLNAPSEFENYMEMPKLLVKELGVPPLVKLLKALYGTKDAPLLWWQLLHNVLVKDLDFVQSTNDTCLYFHKQKKMALGVYVDDMPTAASKENYRWVVQELEKRFKITDKGVLTRCLGMNVIQTVENGKLVSIKLHQPEYIGEVLERFGFQHCTPVYTPAVPNTFLTAEMPNYVHQAKDHNSSKLSLALYPSLVGSLLWISISTRPEISQAVLQLCRFVHNPCLAHLTAAKHVLRFLAGSRDQGLTYTVTGNKTPVIYSDATWGSDPTTQRSMSAYVVILYGAAISWHCGLQASVSLSTTESEWYALSETTKEAMYIKHALTQFQFSGVQKWQSQPMIIKEDNQAVIKISIAGEPKHKHQKHILLRLAFVREAVQSKTILPEFVPSADNVADVLTKNLSKDSFKRLSAMLLG